MTTNGAISFGLVIGMCTLLGFTLAVRSCLVQNHADTTERVKAICGADLLHDSARSAACILALKGAEGGNQ